VGACADALLLLKKGHYDLVIVDFCDESALANFSKEARAIDATLHLIVALPAQSRELSARVLAAGADDIIASPLDPIEFAVLLKRSAAHTAQRDEVRYNRAQLAAQSVEMIGRSEPMLAVFRKLDEVSRSSDPILITGGAGAGKKLLAWSLH